MFGFLETVDLPKVHPRELLEEAVEFLNANGIQESWHMVGLSMSAFRKQSFKHVFMIGGLICQLFLGA